MTTTRINDALTVVLFDSIKEMPAALYQMARQYEVMTSELGAGTEALDQMLDRAERYVYAGKPDLFREQMHNYRLARSLARDGFQPVQLDYACYVHSINGEPITDYAEDALLIQIRTWSRLGLTQGHIETALDDVKKKRSLS